MSERKVEIAVIGGGCAGMAAAMAAKKRGAENVLIIERAPAPGGVLRQCIHNGFGVHRFGEDLTGTEFSGRMVRETEEAGIPVLTETAVLRIDPDEEPASGGSAATGSAADVGADSDPATTRRGSVITVMSRGGLNTIRAGAVVLACGCRERPRGALMIPGTRPAGIFTAGTAQRFLNLEGYLVGRRIVILGSGDIGLIMARQFVLEGAEVLAIAEVMPHSGGLARNIVQCAEDFNIPLLYNTTVTHIYGGARVTGVELSQVDAQRCPVPGTQRRIDCDTLILSVGLIPENELAFEAGIALDPATGGAVVSDRLETSAPGVFACGNALHVHDLADFVTEESDRAGACAAEYVLGGSKRQSDGAPGSDAAALPGGAAAQPACRLIPLQAGEGVRQLVPHGLTPGEEGEEYHISFRPAVVFKNAEIRIVRGGQTLLSWKRRVLAPGEMCTLKLKKELVHFDCAAPVTVEVSGEH